VSSRRNHKNENQGIGLYSQEQEKYTTAFQYFAQIVVGAVFFSIGVLVLIGIFGHRTQETIRFGKPEPHIAGFIAAAAILAWGIFAAHAGVIFWSRRLLAYLRHRHLQQGRT